MMHRHLTSEGTVMHDGHAHPGGRVIVHADTPELPWTPHNHVEDGEIVEHEGHDHLGLPPLYVKDHDPDDDDTEIWEVIEEIPPRRNMGPVAVVIYLLLIILGGFGLFVCGVSLSDSLPMLDLTPHLDRLW